ncbi:MAG: hypothetical protein DCC75_12270 [Proteobacteria bacterium]|nr:MAG: hypothetical protein DCC75_12270 [Pseudomonadota bacterium]
MSKQNPMEPPINYKDLYDRGKYEELSRLCEDRGKEKPSAETDQQKVAAYCEAQLWWIMAQLKLTAVPVGILAAPLQSICDEVVRLKRTGSQHAAQLSEFCAKLIGDLTSKLSDRLVTIPLLERGLELSDSLGAKLKSQVVSALQAEENKGPLERRQNAKRIEYLKNLASRIEKIKPAPPAQTGQPERQPPHAATSGNRTRFWPAILLLVILVTGLLWLIAPWFSRDRSFYARFVEDFPEGEPLLPELERTRKFSKLDAIYYELNEQTRSGEKKDGTSLSGTHSSEIENLSARSALSQSSVAAKVPAREVIDTSGPIEPKELSDTQDQGPIPIDNGTRQEKVNSAPPHNPQFVDFKEPRQYQVMVETSVMSRPSLRGKELAQLNPGDKVQVTGMEGYWLRVKSQKGRLGYVLAQDTEREGDF